jgi:hypothetical protein
MFPKVLYLQKEFCGLEPGTRFELQGQTQVFYKHEAFLIPAEEATENEDWFSATRPRAARAGAGIDHDDEDT